MNRFTATSLLMLVAVGLPACLATRAEQHVSRGMTAAEVKRVLGQPSSQSRVLNRGVPVEIWLYREVQRRADGRTEIVDTSVALRDGRVMDVGALTGVSAEDAPVAPTTVWGRR